MLRPIRTLLIANRGEIVCRIARTAHEMGIRTVAVHSDPDVNSPHIAACDIAVSIGGTRSDESYLDGSKLIDAARRTGADAIHPGYGFLSEAASFAEACTEAGITWVGPPAEAMRLMAGKVAAKERAAALGVPQLPGATIVDDDPGAWAKVADAVGYPVLLKASAGGGGRGMRIVQAPDELEAAVTSGRREAAAAFGNGTVFLERYLPAPRHVEVQVFADEHGSVIHLLERECSIQRRHQKVIEEATSPAVDADLRARITQAAITLAAGIDYVGAGTVEFLVDGDEFFFLEMNTRLQVEHPVTEAVLGLDLVRLQLEVAQGALLPVRQEDVVPDGHAIEARLYAEDVAAGFLPAPGTIHRYERATAPGVRYDDGVESGTVVSSHYDPMIAKVVAHAPTREEAALRLARALEQTVVCGLTTNRDLLVSTLRHPAFLAGETTTAFFDHHPEVLGAGPDVTACRTAAIAAALFRQDAARPRTDGLDAVPSGFRNVYSQGQQRRFQDPSGGELAVEYHFGRAGLILSVDGEAVDLVLHSVDEGTCDLVVDGVRRQVVVFDLGDRLCCHTRTAEVQLREIPRFADTAAGAVGHGPTAPLPGTVVRVFVSDGEAVTAGQPLVVVEAMKMEHTIKAEADAVVASVLVSAGDSVDAHQVLLTFEE